MGSDREESPEIQPTLFELPPREVPEPKIHQLRHPIWTENKARLISNYLFLFEMITKHGTYIDGFAGPQDPDKPETWAAKLVLDLEPRRFRHFYLFEKGREGFHFLQHLKASQPVDEDREILLFHGDFNVNVHELLKSGKISQREAAFCLLDQRTFECHWKTVVALAQHKPPGAFKIELFYFLAAGWFRRAITAVKHEELLELWWGHDDWMKLRAMRFEDVRDELVLRFRSELGYKTVMAWPILDANGRDMYHMLHATDHPDAANLMARAYDDAVHPKKSPEQDHFRFE